MEDLIGLIGKKVRGFKFEDDYVPQMDDHIGEVGEIISVYLKKRTIRVQFNKTTWRYPADQIEKHLVMETGKEVEKLYLTDKVMYIGNAFSSLSYGTYYNLIKEFDNDYLVFDNYGNEIAIPKTDFADEATISKIRAEQKERAKGYMMLKDGYRLKEEAQDAAKKDTHYDNSNGSLYLFAQQHELNAWEFDIIKRVVRCRKKGYFHEDLAKSIRVIELYLKEHKL